MREHHIETLVSDLYESGRDCTADDINSLSIQLAITEAALADILREAANKENPRHACTRVCAIAREALKSVEPYEDDEDDNYQFNWKEVGETE